MIKKVYSILLVFIVIVVFCTTLLGGWITFIGEPFFIPSSSMQPTLLPGDVVYVDKQFHKDKLEVGDIIVFKQKTNNDFHIKRIVAKPKDKIRLENEKIFINDQEQNQYLVSSVSKNPKLDCELLLSEIDEAKRIKADATPLRKVTNYKKYNYYIEALDGESHWMQRDNKKPIVPTKEWVLDEEAFFVMGDHRTNSVDSRKFGFVKAEDIIGVAQSLLFSFAEKPSACGSQPLSFFDVYFRELTEKDL